MKSRTSLSDCDSTGRVGLIAGWGSYPLIVARKLRDQGLDVYCAGIREHADPSLAESCQEYLEVGLAKLGSQFRFFRKHGITRATMAGKIHKVVLFQRNFLRNYRPDWRCLQAYYPHFITGTKDRTDDGLLRTAVDAFARQGIELVGATDLIPELLMRAGQISGAPLSRKQKKDIAFGWRIAKELGRLDIGQTVVVKGQAVIAVEAVEGTDQCIHRAGQICESGGFTVVKVAKPQQDVRFDMPTIGLGTVKTIAQYGGSLLAVEADKTILLDHQQVIAFANQHHIKLLGVTTDDLVDQKAAA